MGRPSAGSIALVAAGTLLAAALWLPDADRERLIAQGVAHQLGADLEATTSEAVAERSSVFGAALALIRPKPPASVHATLWVDGVPTRSRPIERALHSHWNRLRESPPGGIPPLLMGPPVGGANADAADPDRLELELHVDTAGDQVDLTARLVRGDREARVARGEPWRVPGRASLLPPLLALLLGLALGRTLLALFVGVWVGALILAVPESGAWAPLAGLRDVFRDYLWSELVDDFRLEILGFIAALLALVGMVTRAGGLQGLIERALSVARSVRSALLLTAAMGMAIFFDDYANCVLVGNTMRPLTDRLRVSREKLAYVVDSTAAPVAAISLVSTWIAFQVSVYSAQLPALGIQESGYAVFWMALPYRFYCVLTIFFVFAVICTGRDLGPMARAERRARETGRLVREGGRPPVSDAASRVEPAPHMPRDWRVAAGPLLATLAVTLAGIFADGGGWLLLRDDAGRLLTLEGVTQVMLAGSGAGPLLSGALGGLAVALFLAGSNAVRAGLAVALAAFAGLRGPLADRLSVWLPEGAAAALAGIALLGLGAALGRVVSTRWTTNRPHLSAGELARSSVIGSSTLVFAVALLLLAWMIGAVCRDLSTADYLVALSSDALPPAALPLLLFVVAAMVSFATGSSWSTMSILLPNVVALAASVGEASELGVLTMVALCISAVLEGAVFGDHCSPISDTTVLSSVAAGSDHLDHVRTQAPYALLTAGAALLFGYAPLLWIPAWGSGLALVSGAAALLAVLFTFGRRIPDPGRDGPADASPDPLAPA